MRRKAVIGCAVANLILMAGVSAHGADPTPSQVVKSRSDTKGKLVRSESGWWHAIKTRETDSLTPEDRKEMENLAALGYLTGYAPGSGTTGVTVHDETRAYNGFNLVTSAHAPEATLLDMQGNVVHTWRHELGELSSEGDIHTRNSFRRVRLFPNGDLLVIFAHIGMMKIDKDSQLLWFVPNRAHHDMVVADDGRIFVITSKVALMQNLNADKPIRDDFISVFDRQGKLIREVSILDCLINSPYVSILQPRFRAGGDLIHTNALQLLAGTRAGVIPGFGQGNVLFSAPRINSIGVINLDRRSVVWLMSGMFRSQHDPQLLPNGRILLFDNQGNGKITQDSYSAHSRVIEFDPVSQQIYWSYETDPPHDFDSHIWGTVQRLPNGNTLITEGVRGRALEVTHDKEIVWEYISPHRSGEHLEMVAGLLDLDRVDQEAVSWLGD